MGHVELVKAYLKLTRSSPHLSGTLMISPRLWRTLTLEQVNRWGPAAWVSYQARWKGAGGPLNVT